MMVDPDIPPATAGGATSELLHWMQTGLVSANTMTTIAGQQVYELVNPANTSALASYFGPSPPNKVPESHRYTQLLLNTTSNSSAIVTLQQFAATRTNFNAVNAVNSAGLVVLAGNWFVVSNTTGANSTSVAGAGASSTSRPAGSKAGAERLSGGGGGAILAALGSLAAAMMIL